MLSPAEEAEAKRLERKLREIKRLEQVLASGARLDKLQLEKVAGKAVLEDSLVLRKVRAGWQRR